MKTDDPSYVMKIDAKSGKTIWKVDRPTDAIRESPDSYSTPALLQYDGTTEIVITGGDVVTGHDPETGKELWRGKGLNPENIPSYRIVSSPLIAGGLVIAPTRVKPMLAFKPGGKGDVTESHRVWSFDRGPDVPTPVSDGKLLYSVDDRGVVHALELATGKVVYGPERLKADSYSASPVIADGRIYVTSENTGLTSVFKSRREVRDSRGESAQRLLPELSGHIRRADLHPHHARTCGRSARSRLMQPRAVRDPIDPEVERLLIAREKIEAIKFVRQRKGLGLKEAKEYVEAVAGQMPPGTLPPPARIGSVLWLVLLAALLLVWWLARSS